MALFKTPEERATARAEADEAKAKARSKAQEAKAAARKRDEEARYRRSPEGRATLAFERGHLLFQIALTVDDDSAATLSAIEQIGWRLDTAGYAYPVEVSSMSNSNDQVSSIYSSGSLTGIYVFRRA